jgi:hypothetical protein
MSNEPSPPDDLPPPPDQAEWDEAAQEFMLRSLADVQQSAERWSTALGAMLGIFGTVAVVAGPRDITKVTAGLWRGSVVGAIVLAGLCAGVALWLAVRAQLRPSPNSDNWTGSAYQAYVISRSRRGAMYLNISHALGLAATGLVFVAGVLVLLDAALR